MDLAISYVNKGSFCIDVLGFGAGEFMFRVFCLLRMVYNNHERGDEEKKREKKGNVYK